MRIEFYAKNVYGKTNLYIKDPKIAKLVKTLTGRITVDAYDLAALIELGHEVVEVTGTPVALPSLEKSFHLNK